jgi:hypothetical protein
MRGMSHQRRKDAQGELLLDAFDPSIVVCTDLMFSTEWTGAEHGYKIKPLAHNFTALMAGPVDRARELLQLCREAMEPITERRRYGF